MSMALPTDPASPLQETPPPLFELRGISKEFPGVKALDDVSFAIFPGEGFTRDWCHYPVY